MPRPVRSRRQYKAVGFGDAYDPHSVEGHRNALIEAKGNREYNRQMKAFEAQRKDNETLLAKLMGWVRSKFTRSST